MTSLFHPYNFLQDTLTDEITDIDISVSRAAYTAYCTQNDSVTQALGQLVDLSNIDNTTVPLIDMINSYVPDSALNSHSFTETYTQNPDELIESILEAARLAPTAMDKQPVHVWVVRTEEALEKLGKATQYLYDSKLVFMVGCNPSEAWVRKYDGKNGAEVDAAIVGTHIMMEAADLGLGSVWVGSFNPAVIAAEFPELAGWEVVALFPIGYPAGGPSPRHSERKNIEELASEL